MPLHLLGKKSWNVYNPANIERVRRDEAAAQAREEEEERRMDEIDAARRMAILRGERPPSPPPDLLEEGQQSRRDGLSRGPKRRKLAGETDTDRDIRVAREIAEQGRETREQLLKFSDERKDASDAPLMDHAGHINLFPVDHQAMHKAEKNAEREAEEAKKKQEFEDQYTMRFANAAGRDSLGKPWYANASGGSARESGQAAVVEEEPGKNVWGREDPGRKERDKVRMNASDPLAFMKKAQTQLKDAERDRKRWVAEREREMQALEAVGEKDFRSERKRKHSSRRDKETDEIDDMEGFSLDAPAPEPTQPQRETSREHLSSKHHRRHRSRSRSQERSRRRPHRSRSGSRDRDRHRHKTHHSSRKRSKSREHRRDRDGHRSSRHKEREERYRHGRSERHS